MSELLKARREYHRLTVKLNLPLDLALTEVLRDYDVEAEEIIGG